MQITSQQRLEVLLKRTLYADTFLYIQNFKPKQIRFQIIFYNLDHILYSHTCCEWVFYIRDFNKEHMALFYLIIFPPQATPKLSEILHTDIVYTVNINSQSETIYPHTFFSFERKDYTIAELLTVFSADFIDLIYLHNVIAPESPFAAIRVSVPTLNLLIIVIPTSTDYKIYYWDNCPTLGQRLSSQLRPLINNPTLTQVLPPSQNQLVAHTVKRLNNPPPKSHHFFIKKSQAQDTEEHLYSVITTAKSADRPRPTGHSPLYPSISNPVSTHQSQPQIHQTQAQQQPHPINTQTLLPYSDSIANTTFQPPTIIPAPTRAPQPKLLNYSNTPQFSTQPIKFSNTDKTHSSEFPQPIHTVSNIHDTPQDITLII